MIFIISKTMKLSHINLQLSRKVVTIITEYNLIPIDHIVLYAESIQIYIKWFGDIDEMTYKVLIDDQCIVKYIYAKNNK
jgi:hypothetical protein